MGKVKISGRVVSQEPLAAGIYSMWIAAGPIAGQAVPGQFLSVYAKDSAILLPRPISVCEVDKMAGQLRIVYRVVGSGTAEFAAYRAGDEVAVMGPLGNGFPLQAGRAMLIGGGIGIPPLLELAKHLTGEKQMVLGYRDELFLDKEFAPYGDVYLATEDGSAGTKGNVMDAIRGHGLCGDVIYACGPAPMLRAVKAYAALAGIPCWLSMEEKMACGIGACLACVCRLKAPEGQVSEGWRHEGAVGQAPEGPAFEGQGPGKPTLDGLSHYQRVCKEGPVFLAEEVEF